jgi:hypothetical protein
VVCGADFASPDLSPDLSAGFSWAAAEKEMVHAAATNTVRAARIFRETEAIDPPRLLE